MQADCHIHMVLDGADWRAAMGRHQEAPNEAFIRRVLSRYQALGYTYLRDGGDRLKAGAKAREIAPAYGITYRTPLAPLSKAGHYGGFIGLQYATLAEYTALVLSQKAAGADFVKIMISGLMDFDRPFVLTEEGLSPALIRELVHIAHEEGQPVMAHCNGPRTIQAAAEAGADSIEHGAYADEEALSAMAENQTIWVPTLSTIACLLPTPVGADAYGGSSPRHHPAGLQAILDSAMENVSRFAAMGGLVAPGTDAGAHNVPHGSETELPLLHRCGLTEAAITAAAQRLMAIF